MQLRISVKKLHAIVAMSFIVLIQGIIFKRLLSGNLFSTIEESLVFASFVCVLSFALECVIWCRLKKEIFSPYFVFFLVLFIFTSGQTIGWLLGVDMGTKDLWDRVDHGLTHSLLLHGLIYTTLATACFHFGAILATKDENSAKRAGKWDVFQVTQAFSSVGKIMLFLCIPAFIAKTAQDVIAVYIGGYSNYYDVISTGSALMTVISIMAEYYQPCLLILLVANRNDRVKRCFIIVAMLIDVVTTLYVGGRSGAVMTVLGILLAYHFFISPIKKKYFVIGSVAGYFGIAVLNAIAIIRGTAAKSVEDLISTMGHSLSNAIGSFIGELGWSMTSICWTMNLTNGYYPYRYGMSYLAALTSWIPSAFFGGRANHPVVIWANLGDWLQNALNMSYGPGYTMVAESYINFGWYGLLAMVIEGFIIAKFISSVTRASVEKDMLGATFQIIIIMTIMKSLVRSSVSVAFRSCIFTLIPLYCIIMFALRGTKR